MIQPGPIHPVSDIITRIQVCYSQGDLNEAYDLIEQLEKDKAYPSNFGDEMKLSMLKGIVLIQRGEYKAAEMSLLRSLDLANTYGDARVTSKRYDNLVALYTTTNQIHHAIDYLKKSLELKESDGNETAYARSLLQMAALLFPIEDIEGGKEALDKAYSIISQLDDLELKMQYHFLYAMQLKREKKYDEAFGHYDMILSHTAQMHDPFLTARVHANQGDLFIIAEDWDKAKEKFTIAVDIAREHHMSSFELFNCVQLASLALRQNDPLRCRQLYDYTFSHPDLAQNESLREDLAEVASRLYEAEGYPDLALKAHREYMHYYKKHYDNEQSKNVLYIKARYEQERQERELQEVKLRQMESEMKALIAEHTLRESERRFKALIDNGTDMIAILESDLSPSYASPYIFKTLGFKTLGYKKKDDLKGLDAFAITHPEDRSEIISDLKKVRENPAVPVHGQFRMKQKDGQYIWVESTYTNLLHDEAVKGIICNFKNITERKHAEVAIQDLNKSLEIKIESRTAELQDAIKDLEAFSYSVSHDLRSPLRIIIGYARLLLSEHGDKLTGEAEEFINTILDNSKRMGQLIDDLLNLSRLGRKAVYRSPVNIKQIVADIVADFRKEDSTVTRDIIIHDMPEAHCDLALIKQVWINLISNAIKYSRKKTAPSIEIGCMTQLNEIVYYIKDNGAGFDMKLSKNLFGVFKRLHDKSDFDGVGVGLALVHRIVKMHEGRIWADAEVNKGATFFFTLGSSSAQPQNLS